MVKSTATRRILSLDDALSVAAREGKHTMTRNEVVDLTTSIYGPLSSLMKEFLHRQAQLEDWLGFVYIPPVTSWEEYHAYGTAHAALVEATPEADMSQGVTFRLTTLATAMATWIAAQPEDDAAASFHRRQSARAAESGDVEADG